VPWIEGWYFASTESAKIDAWPETSEHPLHEEFKDVYLFNPERGLRVRNFEAIPELGQWLEEKRGKCVYNFYRKIFGTRLTVKIEKHDLIGRGFCHEGVAADDQVITVYGKVIACEKDFGDDELHFYVEFDKESRQTANIHLSAVDMSLPVRWRINEPMAWGGCILFDARISGIEGIKPAIEFDKIPDCTHRWIVPDVSFTTKVDGLPKRIMICRGYVVELEVSESSIPNAGLGVFARCVPLCPNSLACDFELLPGELVDMGLYAPLRASDKKPEHTAMLKNFLLSWKTQSWHFDVHPSDRDRLPIVYDFTSDVSGDLEPWASQSVVPFVNETDGVEAPTVHALYDPSGGVHYLLGHAYDSEPFRLPADGTQIEIKIDYGPKYEKVRVAQGYPRAGRDEQKKLQKLIEDDDYDFIKDIPNSSAIQLIDDIRFLRAFGMDPASLPYATRVRLLLVAASFVVRLVAIKKEMETSDEEDICDNGYSLLEADQTLEKARAIVRGLVKTWPTPDSLQASLFAVGLYFSALEKIIWDPERLSPEELWEKLLSLGENSS